MNNQNLLNLLSKTYLISTSIEDHINRRLNKILHANQTNEKREVSRGASPKSSTHLSSVESGLAGSDDADSNEDISDEGLDISHRLYDNLVNNEYSDDTLIGTF